MRSTLRLNCRVEPPCDHGDALMLCGLATVEQVMKANQADLIRKLFKSPHALGDYRSLRGGRPGSLRSMAVRNCSAGELSHSFSRASSFLRHSSFRLPPHQPCPG